MSHSTNDDPTRESWRTEPIAILASGGLDSAVLLGDALRKSPKVVPMYVRCGTVWDRAEEEALKNYLAAVKSENLAELVVFELPIQTVYGKHWSTSGEGTPDQNSPDEAVYLPGRNLLLLAQPAIWCTLHEIPRIALATLSANPFSDATPKFFAEYSSLIHRATNQKLEIIAPYLHHEKSQLMQIGKSMPLHLTMSCIHPIEGIHCGQCNKCAERQSGFAVAGVLDNTIYCTNENPSSRS